MAAPPSRRRPPSLYRLIWWRYLHCLYSPVVTEKRQFRKFIIFRMMLLCAHYSAIDWSTFGGSCARRFTRARRVCPGRVHCRCSRSSIPDTIRYKPATPQDSRRSIGKAPGACLSSDRRSTRYREPGL